MLSKDFRISTAKRGTAVIQDPLLNKGSAFTLEEREALCLHGLLPPHVSTVAEQTQRAMKTLADIEDPLGKYVNFAAVQDRNEHLFYTMLMENMEMLMPVVYTPTVGLATQHFSHVFQRARGLWLNPGMRGRLKSVMETALADREIRLIVATDNESILGIGDQGAGGMAISVGKLALYVAGAGIDPAATLPISLDVGTNNETLLNDPLYLGWRDKRLSGEAYDTFIDEFVDAVRSVCPDALLQWEDFRKDNALDILTRHRDGILSFNDDIQGTGAVALAGLFSALRIVGQKLSDQRIVIHGAGAAGMGISNQIKAALRTEGVSEEDLVSHICLLDSRGLLVDDQPIRDAYKADLAWPKALADQHDLSDPTRRQLEDVVQGYNPTVLIGTSGQPGVFTEPMAKHMLGYCDRPIIMPFSNPTHMSEATPQDLLTWTDGKALVATGSPFQPVELGGNTYRIGQGNNVFIFPGLGLGALLAQSAGVTDEMVTAASNACAQAVSDEELAEGMLYPAIPRLRDVSRQVAAAVARTAAENGISNVPDQDISEFLEKGLWTPDYPTVHAG